MVRTEITGFDYFECGEEHVWNWNIINHLKSDETNFRWADLISPLKSSHFENY
jgi:hypothetical protein